MSGHYSYAVLVTHPKGGTHIMGATDYDEAQQFSEVVECVDAEVATEVFSFEEPEDVMSIIRTELTE